MILPVAAAELVGLTKGAREDGGCGDGCAQGDDCCEEGCGVHGDRFGGEVGCASLLGWGRLFAGVDDMVWLLLLMVKGSERLYSRHLYTHSPSKPCMAMR